MSLKKIAACLQIALQLLPPSLFSLGAAPVAAEDKVPEPQSAERVVAQTAVQAGSLLESGSGRSVASAITSQATHTATQEIQSWLNQYGTTRINISTEEHFSLQDAELDLLVPLYEQKDALIFTQFGGRRHDDRNIVNAGFGYRAFNFAWMWGVNAFYDRQVSANQHQRLGVGAELGWDYLRLSTNGYYRLSGWKASSAYRDYDERVANGFDVRATGYLPAYPQLGANLVYEQYYGNHVGLFGDDEDDRQKDPYAITVGLSYTPVPLVTLGVNQKTGKGDASDTQFNLALNWAPGVPLSTQLDPDQVGGRRTLLGSRKELVDRNNNIVLDYRKQELIALSLPEKIAGEENARQSVSAKVKSKYGLERIDWQGDSLIRNGGKITPGSDPSQVVITLPAWQSNGSNAYSVTATAWDKHGNASDTARMAVSVNGVDVKALQSSLTSSPARLPADGMSQSTLTLTLKTASGEVATGLEKRLSAGVTLKTTGTSAKAAVAPAVSVFRETNSGVYTATLTSGTTPATLTVQTLIDGSIKLATTSVTEEATTVTAALASLEPSALSALANGVAPVTIVATVVDQTGNALAGEVVNWRADKTTVLLSESKTTTNAKGEASVTLTSNEVVDALVTATLEKGSSLTTPTIKFIADTASAQVKSVSPDKKQVVANNSDSVTYTARVADSSDHPLENVTVNWDVKREDGTSAGGKTSVSDSAGNATLSLSSAKTGVAYVYADVNQKNAMKAEGVTFVADTSTQRVDTVESNKKEAVANGSDSLVYTAKIVDLQGNPIPDVVVNWSADNADVKLAAASTRTDAQGNASLKVTSLKAGTVIITAQTPDSAPVRAESAKFIGDAGTAKLSAVQSDKDRAVANGTDGMAVSATIVDANGNPVEGAQIGWEVTPSTATLADNATTSDASGVARAMLRSTSAGVYTVRATLDGSSMSLANLTFTGDTSTSKVATVTADKTTHIVADSDTALLTATVVDGNQNPVAGVTVNWSSSDTANVTLTSTSAITNAQGQVETRFSSRKAGTVTVTATANGSSQNLGLTVVGNPATAQFADLSVDKKEEVADGTAKISWTASVEDANHNPLTGVDVAWSVDNSSVNLSGVSTKTDGAGQAVVSASTTTAGTATVSATLTGVSVAKSAEPVSFVGDVASARLESLTASADHAVVNTDRITYTAVVKDVNGNLVKNTTVNWTTTLNTLSATSSLTNASGVATVKLSGPDTGTAEVTAEINGSALSDQKVIFIASYHANWNISSSAGSTSRFNTEALFGFPSLGFQATGNTQGPTSLVWEGAGYSTLTVPMVDEKGTSWNVVFRGQRRSDCSTYVFNAAVTCSTWKTTGYTAKLQYLQEDNPTLPSGVYRGDIEFVGKDWHTSWSLDYTVTTTLTQN
jgi:adhesin/invasin